MSTQLTCARSGSGLRLDALFPVHVLMSRQLIGPRERLVAPGLHARVRPRPCMCAQLDRGASAASPRPEAAPAYVFRQIRRLRKRPITIRALEGLVAVVRALVDRERAGDGERLAAAGEVADVRFWSDRGKPTWYGHVCRLATYFLVYGVAYAAQESLLQRRTAHISRTGMAGDPYGSTEGVSIAPRQSNRLRGAGRSPVNAVESFACSRSPSRHASRSPPSGTRNAPSRNQRVLP